MSLRLKVKDWFYSTWLGGKYLELLLWVDEVSNRDDIRYLTPKEMAQIIRESSKISEGTVLMKQNINKLVASKSKEEYHKVLSEIDELIQFGKGDDKSAQGHFAAVARQMYVKKGGQDIVTATDRAKMIDQRIQDMYELQQQRARQGMWRQIRKLRTEGKINEAEQLQEEWMKKYGRSRQ